MRTVLPLMAHVEFGLESISEGHPTVERGIRCWRGGGCTWCTVRRTLSRYLSSTTISFVFRGGNIPITGKYTPNGTSWARAA